MEKNFRYIEIYNMDTNEIYRRIEITGKSERSIERSVMGIMMNLRDDCLVDEDVYSESKLKCGDCSGEIRK